LSHSREELCQLGDTPPEELDFPKYDQFVDVKGGALRQLLHLSIAV
jgi:hypothetical protein